MNDLYVAQLHTHMHKHTHTVSNKHEDSHTNTHTHTRTHKGGPLTLLFDFVCASLGLL